jgi:uncharacterized protein
LTTFLEFLPPGIGPWVLAILLTASFLGSFITVAFGIGGGALLLAIMAVVVPPAALIPVHGVIQISSNAVRAALLFRFVHWPGMLAFAIGTAVGCALGGAIMVELPARAVQAGVGLFILWSVLARPPAALRRWPALVGGVSSFLTMFFGATGVFVANYTKSLQLERHSHVASHATMMTMQHLLKVLVFGFLGFAFGPWLTTILGMVIAGVLGTLAGKLVLGRMSDHGFRRALDAILILISLRLVWSGVMGG